MGKLIGKVAFITGTAQGTGRSAAILFAAEGATVVGCDLKIQESEETASIIQRAGGKFLSIHPVDLGDREQASLWIGAAAKKTGGIDILFNNAATPRFAPIEKLSAADWEFTLRNELNLIFHVTQAAWPYMLQRKGGAIINMASMSGISGDPNVGASAHAAAKGGVIALTKQLAAEGAKHNIRVNSISPGPIRTPAAQWTLEIAEKVNASIPLGRAGTPEDISPCALFLASGDASWITGANFVIDGGRSSVWPKW